ncbi:hypothetical protein [Streptomyces chartreusis]
MAAHLRQLDLSQQWNETSANANLVALAALGDSVAVPVVADTLNARPEQHDITRSALKALAVFGPAAAGALNRIRSLSKSTDGHNAVGRRCRVVGNGP